MPSRVCPKSGCVADELSVDDVGEASFDAAQRFSVAFAGSPFSSVVVPSWAIAGECFVTLTVPRNSAPPARRASGDVYSTLPTSSPGAGAPRAAAWASVRSGIKRASSGTRSP